MNYIAGELFLECLVSGMVFPEIDKEKTDQLMGRILRMQDELISRISHTEPGNVKGFYKKFREDFNKEVEAIIDEIENLKK